MTHTSDLLAPTNLEQRITDELATLSGFQAWLEAQDDTAIVGTARSACNCPLTQYLNQAFNCCFNTTERAIGAEGKLFDHSQVSKRLVGMIDRDRKCTDKITAAEAKIALKQAIGKPKRSIPAPQP